MERNAKCPSCGANLKQKICPYCGYEMYIPNPNQQATAAKVDPKAKYEFEKEYSKAASIVIDGIRNCKFNLGFRGYDIGQVDRFLDELISNIYYHGNYNNIKMVLDGGAIENVKFEQSIRGYDIRYVDVFLDKVIEDIKVLSRIKEKY